MKGTCYWCHTAIPSGQVKRCSQCRLTTYCSRLCQTLAWKAGHKQNCSPNGSYEASISTPPKNSEEWMAQEVDRTLSKWLERWRSVFYEYATIALNLPNHPPEYVSTHCMVLFIISNVGSDNKLRDYLIEEASVRTIDEVQHNLPQLKGVAPADPPDLTKVKFVIILRNEKGHIRSARCIKWNDLGIDGWRRMPKALANELAEVWADTLKYAVGHLKPEDVSLRKLSGKR